MSFAKEKKEFEQKKQYQDESGQNDSSMEGMQNDYQEEEERLYRENGEKSQYNTFQPNNQSHRIDYSKGLNQYLSEVGKLVERSHSKASPKSNNSQQSKQDREVQSIINEVLNKRKKTSRYSNTDQCEFENESHKKRPQMNIEKVNQRLNKQNQELAANIKKLLSKIKHFNEAKTKSYSTKSNTSTYSQNKSSTINGSALIEQNLKQIEKLRQRLEKAEKANSRMQLELSRLEQSRKTNKSRKKATSIRKLQQKDDSKVENCTNCNKNITQREKDGENKKKNAKVTITSNSTSPLKKDYYSPIMQFQQYSLNNEPTISLYDNNLHKTSQFGVNLIQSKKNIPKMSNKSIQTQWYEAEVTSEEKQLDEQIIWLESIITKNNITITNYENLLLKQII